MTSTRVFEAIISRYSKSKQPHIIAFDSDKKTIDIAYNGSYVRLSPSALPNGIVTVCVSDIRTRDYTDADAFPRHDVIGDEDDLGQVIQGIDAYLDVTYGAGAWGVTSHVLHGEDIHDGFVAMRKERPSVFCDVSHAIRHALVTSVDPLRVMSVTTDDAPVCVSRHDGQYAEYVRRTRAGESVTYDSKAIDFVCYRKQDYELVPDKVIELVPMTTPYDPRLSFEMGTIIRAIHDIDGTVTSMDTHTHDHLTFRLEDVDFRIERISDHDFEFDMWCEATHEHVHLIDEDDWDDFDEENGRDGVWRDESAVYDEFASKVGERMHHVNGMLNRNAMYVSRQFDESRSWFTVDDIGDVPIIPSNVCVSTTYGQYKRGSIKLSELVGKDGWHRIAEYPNPHCWVEARVTSLVRRDARHRIYDDSAIIAMRRTDDDGATWSKWNDGIRVFEVARYE